MRRVRNRGGRSRIAAFARRARWGVPGLLVLLGPIAWVFRGVLRGETYAMSWWYAYDPLFASARTFGEPLRARTIWDPSPSALNAVADRFAVESLARLELPLWNPYHALGTPLLAEVHPVVLSPLRWLVSYPLGGGDVGTTALMIAQLALAAMGAFGWLRACDRSREAALVAGATYPFVGGAIAALHFTTTAGTTAMPYMLWAGERLVREPTRANAARFGLAAGCAAFVTHPSVAFVCGVGAGLYVAVRALGRREPTARILGYSLVAGAIALGLASLLVLPFLELMEHGWTYKSVVDTDDVFPDQTRRLFLPPISSVSAFPVALLVVGALGVGARARERWALVVMFYVAIGLVFDIPGSSLLTRIPSQALFGRAYIVIVACAAATGLFARALDTLARGHRDRALRAGAAAAMVIVALAALRGLGALRLEAWRAAASWPDTLRAGVALALVLGLLALAFAPAEARRAWTYRWVYLCVLVEILPRASVHIRPEPRFDFPETPALAFLRREAEDGERVISVGTWSSHRTLTAHVPNVGLVTHLHDVRSADPLFVRRTRSLLDPISARSWYAILFWSYPEPRGQSTAASRRPTLLEMLGVRYALGRPGDEPPHGHREVYRDDTVVAWENPLALPRAYVVHEASHVPDVQVALIATREVDLSQVVVIDGPEPPPLPPPPRGTPAPVRIARLEPRHVTLEATLEAEGYVVLTDAYYPGWVATVDGAPATIWPANVAVRAVRVPAGTHRIEMHYAPRSVSLGLGVSGASLAMALALLLGERRRSRARALPAR